MKARLFAAIVAGAGLVAMTLPAGACPNGYHAVWIQGHKVCRINTPKLPLKLKTNPEPSGKSGAIRSP